MLAEERRANLLQVLNDTGYIQVADFAEKFSISSATIRRDLMLLEQEGLCIRKRGGALRASDKVAHELPYAIKQFQNVAEKKRISLAAAELISEGDHIILDAGSTTFAVAQAIVHRKQLTVVTNDLQIAVCLASNPNINLVCTGGSVRQYVYSLQGWQTETFIKHLKVAKTFLGADAIDPEGYVINTNLDEVGIKQAMVDAADKVILVTDSTKFDKTGFYRVCDLNKINLLLTDSAISTPALDLLRSKGVAHRMV
jgi:DeoR family transcriptional regulator, aga operon transcriptional repressor